MHRNDAHQAIRHLLDENGLKGWGIRFSTEERYHHVQGMCVYDSQTIIISAHHLDLHPDAELIDTFKHEVAHAIVGPGHGHDYVWAAQAEKLGARTTPCNQFALPAHIVDAIRSGKLIEVEYDTIIVPKYKIGRLQDKCPECGKPAKELFSIDTMDREGNDIKLITLDCFHIIKKTKPKATPFQDFISNGWKDEVKNCKHEFTKNQCNVCGEFKMFDFQLESARNAEIGLNLQKGYGIFHDMGLGKTVIALATVRYHPEYAPTLYVVKSAITFKWLKEIVRWLGPEWGGQIIRTSKDFIYPNLKTYIISASMLSRIKLEKLTALKLRLVIIDECQAFSNPDSSRTRALRTLVTSDNNMKVIPLSGTPWKNRGSEFFTVLNMIDPLKFNSYQGFIDRWVAYYYEGAKKKMGGIRNPEKFREYTKDMLIRYEFDEVMDEFPSVNRMKLNVQLDELAQTSYDETVSDFVNWYNQAVISGEEDSLSGMEILAKLSRMRHITGLAKIPATLGYIEEFVEDTDKKLTVFVHHRDVGELLVNALTNTNEKSNPDYFDLAKTLLSNGIKVMKLTAEFSDAERFNIQETFNKTSRVILIASTLASGEGIDLQTCHDAILHERQWNPANENQAAPGRFKRIGQLSKVINITYVEAEDTVDEFFDNIVETKRRNFHVVMNTTDEPTWSEGDMVRELAELIVAKHKKKFGNKPQPVKSITAQVNY